MEKTIIATDETIEDIVNAEIERLGNNADLNHIDVCQVTEMRGLFYGSDFNGDISRWDVSHVGTMEFMFEESAFDGDLSRWNVANVEYMDAMFAGSALEKNGHIPAWYDKTKIDPDNEFRHW